MFCETYMAVIMFILGCLLFVPDFGLHRVTVHAPFRIGKVMTWLVAACVILVLILPMKLAPHWNGTIQDHRNQYELMAESLLEGRLYIDYQDIDPRLEEMENPYDPEARKEAEIAVHWDHAWYNGHYYMYFGIVPVLFVFLPFRILAGHALNTMYATMLFTGLGVVGLFALFEMLVRRFFPKMTLGTYLILSISVSFISFWYASGFPALYCTAITSGMCLEIWSFYFFFRAVYVIRKENHQILCAAFGALCGALAVGCRPTVALANFLVLPLLAAYLLRKKDAGELNRRLAGKLFLAALPYFIVIAGLMIYNDVRFDSPFEFGQSYQLTVADQHMYGSFLSTLDPETLFNGIKENLFKPIEFTNDFPWVSYGGVCWSFPLLLLGMAVLLPKVLRAAGKERMAAVLIGLLFLPPLITMFDVLWSPYLLERYQMDIVYLMGISTFLAVGFLGEQIEEKKKAAVFRGFVSFLGVAAILSAVLLWLVPNDYNYTDYVEGALEKTARWLFFLKP